MSMEIGSWEDEEVSFYSDKYRFPFYWDSYLNSKFEKYLCFTATEKEKLSPLEGEQVSLLLLFVQLRFSPFRFVFVWINQSMKCVCFFWSLLVYHNLGVLLSRDISITRKAKLPMPGSSPDEFIIYNSRCSSGGNCEEFGAVQASGNKANDVYSQNCLCVCKPGRETVFYQDKSWKCLDDNVLRNRTGIIKRLVRFI